MGAFLTPLILEQLPDGFHWKYVQKFQYQDDVLGLIEIEAGFVTNGGDVPSLVQGFINPYGRGFRAFGVHDYLYATQKFTREQSDDCMRRALALCGENCFDQDVQWKAVRGGGESAWKRDQINYNIPVGERHD